MSLGPCLWEFYNYPEHVPDLSLSYHEKEPQGSIFPPGKDNGIGSFPPTVSPGQIEPALPFRDWGTLANCSVLPGFS